MDRKKLAVIGSIISAVIVSIVSAFSNLNTSQQSMNETDKIESRIDRLENRMDLKMDSMENKINKIYEVMILKGKK